MRVALFLLKLLLLFLFANALFFIFLEIFYPINLNKAKDLSRVVYDRDGRVLYTTLNGADKWRFKVNLKHLDLGYKKMLLNFEDKRFYEHFGVDYLALIRASWQLIKSGHITSGGSTITMQLARLLEPKSRTIGSKITEIFRAYQLELHYSKDEILSAYLTLAPYGGNVEGVVGASLRYFNKLPSSLTPSQSAMLVALPQSPEHNRPDKHKKWAKLARDKVLKRALEAKIISQNSYKSASLEPIDAKLYNFPRFAPHLSNKLLKEGSSIEINSTIYLPLQDRLESWAKGVGATLPKGATMGVVVVKNSGGEVYSYIGSYNIFNREISGYVDINQAIRSPGSILKPLIYGMALESRIVDVNTIIKDDESQFGNYHPHNFNKKFNDEVTVAYALQNSLNIPAVKILQKVGAHNFIERLQLACGKVVLPKDLATLPVALGGLGIKPIQIAQLYAIIANGGEAKKLHFIKGKSVKSIKVLEKSANIELVDILREVTPPLGFSNQYGFLAYKTGTSYGYRDFWSVVFSKEYSIVVIVAKANNSSIVKSSARKIALPLAFEAFSYLKELLPHNSWSHDSKTTTQKIPTLALKYLNEPKDKIDNFKFITPKDGSKFQSASCQDVTVLFKLKGGNSPYNWYIDGKPKDFKSKNIEVNFEIGAHTISVIDSSGEQKVVNIWVDKPECN